MLTIGLGFFLAFLGFSALEPLQGTAFLFFLAVPGCGTGALSPFPFGLCELLT